MAALVSGGKDSMLAVYRMHLEGHRIKYLLSMETESSESYMFHHPNIWMTELMSKTTGIPLKQSITTGEKEEELEDLSELIGRVSDEVEGVVTGAMASTYQKMRIDQLCEEHGLQSISPLWGIHAKALWKELFDNRFEVIITAVAAGGLDESWLGRTMDEEGFNELSALSEEHRFHLGFEGGEAETLVLNMPMYTRRIAVREARATWDGTCGTYNVLKAELEG